MEASSNLIEEEPFYSSLYVRIELINEKQNAYCMINETADEIDNEQQSYNQVETRYNDAALKLNVVRLVIGIHLKLIQGNEFNLDKEAESVIQSIRFYAAFVRATVAFTSLNDMVFYYHFADDFVFVRIIYSNGILLRVKGGENVHDPELKSLLRNLGVGKRVRDKQYQCTKLYEFIADVRMERIGNS